MCLTYNHIAGGAKFKGLFDIQGLIEIIFGEIIVKSPYTPNLPTNIVGFRGFDSSTILI